MAKIALLGSAPSSVGKAPVKNSTYQQWTEGRVDNSLKPPESVAIPGDYEIWACSPGAWSVTPRITRFFEVHRIEPDQSWFPPEYCRFLQTFKGPVYTGAPVPSIPNHVVYPIDRMEEKFSSYFFTSSLALMLALAIDEIEIIRQFRKMATDVLSTTAVSQYESEQATKEAAFASFLKDSLWLTAAKMIHVSECDKDDRDDVIALFGVDMGATEEFGYQRPGCQFFILEALRRGIGVYLPPESDLLRPMPVYGISEWDHNYIKLTTRAREINTRLQQAQQQAEEARNVLLGAQGELRALNQFVNTWTSPYGMPHGITLRHEPGTGLGSGITHLDARPVERMNVVRAMSGGQSVSAASAKPVTHTEADAPATPTAPVEDIDRRTMSHEEAYE